MHFCWTHRIFLPKILITKNILLLNIEKWKNFYYFICLQHLHIQLGKRKGNGDQSTGENLC